METYIGKVTHFYSHLHVAVIELAQDLKTDCIVHFLGHTTDFYQPNWSMEIDHRSIEVGLNGQAVAIKVDEIVREGDEVYVAPDSTADERREIFFYQHSVE